jgi:hypothetical protein
LNRDEAVRLFFVSDGASAGGGTHSQNRGAFPEAAIWGVEQPVVFKMARCFNLQDDSGARERGEIVESELHFDFVRDCCRDHMAFNGTARVSKRFGAARMVNRLFAKSAARSRARRCTQSGYLPGLVFRIEFERAGGYLAETFAAAQADGERDQLVLASKFEAAFGHTTVYLADVQR